MARLKGAVLVNLLGTGLQSSRGCVNWGTKASGVRCGWLGKAHQGSQVGTAGRKLLVGPKGVPELRECREEAHPGSFTPWWGPPGSPPASPCCLGVRPGRVRTYL